jgi:hypothetical protein
MSPKPWIIDDFDPERDRPRIRPPAPAPLRDPGQPPPQEQRSRDRGVEIVEISPEDDAIRI